MRAVWNAAEKDLRRHLRDPISLVLWLGIPLMIGGLLTLVVGGPGAAPPIVLVLVADEDGGILSGLLRRAFAPGGEGQFLVVEEVSRETGRDRIGQGEATALLVIPEGFGMAVLREEPATLLLVTNPAQRILPRIVEEGLEIVVDGSFYIHRVIGPELQEIVAGPPQGQPAFSNDDIARIGAAFNGLVPRLQKYLFPPVFELEAAVDRQEDRPTVNMASAMLPSILFMSLLFLAGSLSGDVWRERDMGTLRRAACSPSSLAALLAGKVLAASLVVVVGALTVLLVGMLYLNLPLRTLPLATVWAVMSGLLFFLLLTLTQLHASSQRGGTVLSNCVVFPLMFLGGSFVPFEAMPEWMAAVGRKTPNGWALSHLSDILFGRADAASLGLAITVVAVASIVLFFWSERRLRRVFVRS